MNHVAHVRHVMHVKHVKACDWAGTDAVQARDMPFARTMWPKSAKNYAPQHKNTVRPMQ